MTPLGRNGGIVQKASRNGPQIVPSGRILARSIMAISGVLFLGPSGQAGIYLPSDPNPFPAPSGFSQIRLSVGEYRSLLAGKDPALGIPEKGSLREQILNRTAELEARLDTLKTPAEMLEITGCWLRTGLGSKVIEYLGKKRITGDDADSVLLLSHLAMAQAQDPALLPRAISTQEDVLERWPETIKDWKYPKWRHFRRAEAALLALWRARHRENLASGGAPVPVKLDSVLGLDTLEARDNFKPGKPPKSAWDRLDPEAESLVVQLILWLPADSRLYWAFGEVLNAKGDTASAFKIMTELVEARQMSGVDPLFKHRAALSREVGQLDETGGQAASVSSENKPAPVGEFPMEAYLKAVGLGIAVGAGGLILLWLQWQFLFARRNK